jgi:hypothetical protein
MQVRIMAVQSMPRPYEGANGSVDASAGALFSAY